MELTLLETYGLDLAAYIWFLKGNVDIDNDKPATDPENMKLIKFDRMCGMHDFMLYLLPGNFNGSIYNWPKFINRMKTLTVKSNKFIYGYIEASRIPQSQSHHTGPRSEIDYTGYINNFDSHSFYIFSDDENAIVYNTCGSYGFHHVTEFKIDELNTIFNRLSLAQYVQLPDERFEGKTYEELYGVNLYTECYNLFKVDVMFNFTNNVDIFNLKESVNEVVISDMIVIDSMYRIRDISLHDDRPFFDHMIKESENYIAAKEVIKYFTS